MKINLWNRCLLGAIQEVSRWRWLFKIEENKERKLLLTGQLKSSFPQGLLGGWRLLTSGNSQKNAEKNESMGELHKADFLDYSRMFRCAKR